MDWTNIFFKVSCLNHGHRYSRFASFAISSSKLDPIHSLKISSDLSRACQNLFSDLNESFPELTDEEEQFKLISPDSNDEFIPLETYRDLYALVCSNMDKCLTGVAIPLSIVEWPPKNSDTIKQLAASKDGSVPVLIGLLEKVERKLQEQGDELKRLADEIRERKEDSRENDSVQRHYSDAEIDAALEKMVAIGFQDK